MSQALEKAHLAEKDNEVPVGSIITLDNKIIGTGKNSIEKNLDPTAHAEIQAIKEATSSMRDWRLNNCIIYSTLEPCIMCIGAIIHARISEVVFGCRDLKWGGCGTIIDIPSCKNLNHKVKISGPFREDECTKILSDFFKGLRTKK